MGWSYLLALRSFASPGCFFLLLNYFVKNMVYLQGSAYHIGGKFLGTNTIKLAP